MPRAKATRAERFDALRADWQAGKRSRFVRERRNTAGPGDAQYANETEFARIREYVRDMDRGEPIVGSLADRAVVNQLQGGFRIQPETGDKGLDNDLKARFAEWAGDARLCDHAWDRTFWQMCHGWLRQTYIDGDICAILTEGGSVQTLESDRLRSPAGNRPDIVHGIELSSDRRKIAYWFGADPGKSRQSPGAPQRRRAHDDAGEQEVLHVTNPMTRRSFSQTRGVSAFAPAYYRMGMLEDTQFATLLQRQLVSSLVWFVERGADWQGGTATLGRQVSGQATPSDAGLSTLEETAPGMIARGAKGEKLSALNTSIPSPEYMPYVRMILQEISVSIGLPLVLALMDAKETNFSGFRGAVDAARMGFRANQKWFAETAVRPIYRWQVRRWLSTPVDEGGLGAAARLNPLILRARVTPPNWPYIQPLDDARANELRMGSMQLSPAQFAREQGFEWDDHVTETVSNWEHAIITAKESAARINTRFPEDAQVHWRELLNLGTSDGMKSELVRAAAFAEQSANQGGDNAA